MTYKELKRRIKEASKELKEDGMFVYIAYWGDKAEGLVSNFMDDDLLRTVTDDQLIKAENENLLIRDWDTLIVV